MKPHDPLIPLGFLHVYMKIRERHKVKILFYADLTEMMNPNMIHWFYILQVELWGRTHACTWPMVR